MRGKAILNAMPIVCAGFIGAACADQPTAPGAGADVISAAANVVAVLPPTLTARAELGPYFINQSPELMLRSQVTADFAIQRLETESGGGGGWHTHPGPSFAIVEEGAVMITRYDRKSGCTSTVYGPGQPAGKAYYEVADEVHIALVVSSTPALEYKVRFNVPAGESFGKPANAPPC